VWSQRREWCHLPWLGTVARSTWSDGVPQCHLIQRQSGFKTCDTVFRLSQAVREHLSLSARRGGTQRELLLRGCLLLEGCGRWKQRFHNSSLRGTPHAPVDARGQVNSVSAGAAPQGEAVIIQRWNWKSCKFISWLRLDGYFWITGLLLSKWGAGRVSGVFLLEPNSVSLDGINISRIMDGYMAFCWDICTQFVGLFR